MRIWTVGMVLMVVVGLLLTAPARGEISGTPPPTGSGDWSLVNDTVIRNETVTLDGNFYTNGYNLTIVNSTIVFTPSSNNVYNFLCSGTTDFEISTVYLENSTIRGDINRMRDIIFDGNGGGLDVIIKNCTFEHFRYFTLDRVHDVFIYNLTSTDGTYTLRTTHAATDDAIQGDHEITDSYFLGNTYIDVQGGETIRIENSTIDRVNKYGWGLLELSNCTLNTELTSVTYGDVHFYHTIYVTVLRNNTPVPDYLVKASNGETEQVRISNESGVCRFWLKTREMNNDGIKNLYIDISTVNGSGIRTYYSDEKIPSLILYLYLDDNMLPLFLINGTNEDLPCTVGISITTPSNNDDALSQFNEQAGRIYLLIAIIVQFGIFILLIAGIAYVYFYHRRR